MIKFSQVCKFESVYNKKIFRAEEFEDNSALAKWSSLDLLAEEEDATSPTAPTPQNKQGDLQ